jgi:hypothetical protein
VDSGSGDFFIDIIFVKVSVFIFKIDPELLRGSLEGFS